MSNRDFRRASARGKLLIDAIETSLTRDEAGIIEEALDLYHRHLAADTDGEMTAVQAWAYERSAQMCAAVRAAIEGRSWHEPATTVRFQPEPADLATAASRD